MNRIRNIRPLPRGAIGALAIGTAFATITLLIWIHSHRFSLDGAAAAAVFWCAGGALFGLQADLDVRGRPDHTAPLPAPEPGDWQAAIEDMVTAVGQLTDEQLADLDDQHAIRVVRPGHPLDKAAGVALRLGYGLGRIPRAVRDDDNTRGGVTASDWDDLRIASTAAYHATLAIAVRELLSRTQFVTLTAAWCAAGLPLVDGDAPALITARADHMDDDGQWITGKSEKITCDLGESMHQVLAGIADQAVAAQLYPHETLRICGWAGTDDDGEPDDYVVIDRPELIRS